MEAPDEKLLQEWTDNWKDLVEFDIIPVRTSEEAASVIEANQ